MRHWQRLFLGFCFSAIFLTIGAVASDTAQAATSSKDHVTIATSGGTFNCKGGDPATQTGSPPYVSQTCFDSLVSVTPDRRFTPALAESFQIAPGWTHIDFILRDNIKFHNGDPVTAEDVKYTLETYMTRKYRYVFGGMWRRVINEVEIVSPKLIRVHLKNADWGFIGRLWWGGGIMPKAYREKVGDQVFSEKPIGAGPFKWTGFKQDAWFTLEAVPDHYRYPPKFKTLKMIYVMENSTRLAMLQSGEVDIAPIMAAHIRVVESDPNLRIHWVKYVSGSNIYFADLVDPDTPSPFHDIRVRKAVGLAIDRKTICEKIRFGASEPWGDVLPPITLGYDPTLKPEPYDPEKAKTLLKEAGYPHGFDTTISAQGTSASTATEALVANLADIGIKAKLELYESGTYYDKFFSRKLRGLVPYVGWYDAEFQAPAELSDFYLKGTAHAYVTTDEIDATLRKAMYAETEEELTEWGRKISKIVRESYVSTFLYANHSPYVLGSRIKKWEPSKGCIPAIAFETVELK